jgi:hypothetical protein
MQQLGAFAISGYPALKTVDSRSGSRDAEFRGENCSADGRESARACAEIIDSRRVCSANDCRRWDRCGEPSKEPSARNCWHRDARVAIRDPFVDLRIYSTLLETAFRKAVKALNDPNADLRGFGGLTRIAPRAKRHASRTFKEFSP